MNGMPAQADILKALSAVQEPELHRDLVSLNMIRNLQIDDGRVRFSVMLTTPACPLRSQIERECQAAVMTVPGVKAVAIEFHSDVVRDRRLGGQANSPFRNTIAVASGKGGVGKTTVAVNLAIALQRLGATVGLLDADIYGPNVPMMMGAEGHPRLRGKRILPLEAFGVRLMSMGFLLKPDQPVVWRGPMLHSALQQFLGDVEWGDLDYLIIDLPPGTGDIQLSLAQLLPLTGAVVVTTPQDVALGDVRKGMAAFSQLEVPLLGLIENMSYFVCGHCGERTDIFSHGGGRRAAEELRIPFLGEIALDPAIRAGGDDGQPIVAVAHHSPQSQAFMIIAGALAAKISVLNIQRQGQGLIQISEIG
jgi:ATP-binding protein involved in chromosome partitioning